MSPPDVLIPARELFQPVIDLESGAVVAVEAQAPDAGTLPPDAVLSPVPTDDAVRADISRAAHSAEAGALLPTRLPLMVTVRAETVARGEPVLTELHRRLTATGRRPGEFIVTVAGGFPPFQRQAVTGALGALRRAGYLVGLGELGAAHAPLDLLAETVPYLVAVHPDLVRRAPSDPRRAALVRSLVELAHGLGTHLLAPGLATEDQVLQQREMGVRLALGPAFAPPEWRPGMPVTVPVTGRDGPGPARPAAVDLGPRVSEFTLPAMTLPDTATADEVLTTLNSETGATSVVLVDGRQRPVASVDRTRFLLKLSGAYGHALHAHKPATRLADRPRLVPRTVPAVAALRAAGQDAERVYDDLVVTDEVGRCIGIVRVADLIRGMAP
ncbi:EAL domain-containing protein [Actinomadura rupiterrae]|uniref:EAL domain-containing protein n=1 Tax=Actinomadura rupiterrae TaxID=559627 RepID=UPI0020A58473|nr:EAL domain-containing protein [Actinomadura rupiterrae]MCP2341294.1 EAL domain-containing protein (putative c-di-GMP-specific phosphodiesterase class I) [Actinomadura rupiterrae]